MAYPDPYLFSASFTVVDEQSHSSFHRFLQTSEILSNKNEKICVKNLPLSAISGILIFGYHSGDTALLSNSPHKTKRGNQIDG